MPADEFQQFGVFVGRHSKSLKFVKITSLLARARGRFVKIVKIDMLVARVWGTSAKQRCLGLEKYAYRNQICLFNTAKLHDFVIYDYNQCSFGCVPVRHREHAILT